LNTERMPGEANFTRILVAFDGSKDATNAVRFAANLSKRFGAELIVAHVFGSPSVGLSAASGMPLPDYSELEGAAKAGGQAVLAAGLQVAADSGVKAKGELKEAPSVVEALVEYAAGEKVDLIVVGTRGMTGFKKLIMGSVSSGLVSHAHCPVLVTR
jgi:nucleotide-binding universal stress UspA family protein